MEGALTEITDHAVFTHPDEVVVELHGYTPEGEFTAITYQFRLSDGDETHLHPRQPINTIHEDTVHDILTEHGYTVR